METPTLMLGVSGLRGIVGQSLTPEVVARYAAALATWLHQNRPSRPRARRPTIVLGMDGRLGGDILMHTAAQALRACGCDVLIMCTIMTPSIGVVVDHTRADAGLIITASHNPQEWNGLKIVLRPASSSKRAVPVASAPSAALAAEIIDIYHSGNLAWRSAEDLGDYIPRTDVALYERHETAILDILKHSGDLRRIRRRKFKVALDTVGGAGRIWAPRFVEALNCELHDLYPVERHCGIFPHTPEPTRENLTALCRATRRHKADIGFAIDPDGDRLAIVDERGHYIGEEYTLALAAESLLSAARATKIGSASSAARARTPLLITNLSTSRMLDDIAARHSARVLRTPVGEANVVDAMKRETAAGYTVLLGGEGNGGIIWPRVTYIRDSLSAIALTLSLMARTRSTISQLVAQIPAYAIEKRRVDLTSRQDAQPAIQKLADACHRPQLWAVGAPSADATPPTTDLQDGIRIDFPARRAWLHIRPSNTEPIMRLIAEAPTSTEASRILDKAREVMLCA